MLPCTQVHLSMAWLTTGCCGTAGSTNSGGNGGCHMYMTTRSYVVIIVG